jgi:hypothetical protein
MGPKRRIKRGGGKGVLVDSLAIESRERLKEQQKMLNA